MVRLSQFINNSNFIKNIIHRRALSPDMPFFKLRMGSSFHNKGGELHRIKEVIQHKRFNKTNNDFDYALLKLRNPLKFTQSIQSILLPKYNDVLTGNTLCFVTGWGDTQNIIELNIQLCGAYVPIFNQNHCNESYREFGGITTRMLCAGYYEEGGKDCELNVNDFKDYFTVSVTLKHVKAIAVEH